MRWITTNDVFLARLNSRKKRKTMKFIEQIKKEEALLSGALAHLETLVTKAQKLEALNTLKNLVGHGAFAFYADMVIDKWIEQVTASTDPVPTS